MTKKKILILLGMAVIVIVTIIGITASLEENENDSVYDLGNGLHIIRIESYSGEYVEDGSNQEVSNVLMIEVENKSKEPIEYAIIQMMTDDGVAEFAVSALMSGEKAVVLEKNRMIFSQSVDYTKLNVVCPNLANFQNEISLNEDKIEVQVLEGAVNIKNISGKDINENIAVYYKNKKDGVYLGGITYRITFSGGLKKDEIKQKMAKHLYKSNSEILFVTMV